ncbi:hypothetical protein DHW03_15055 [Pedobacter yonginense]|uniref:Uncharacterized protein n=1 Tax=Pedobacter yonginense TaxID=651869 RepID=A0A317EHQ0_9SPHI|nr:hypothetical protein [Pedobacter yonginense]PWS26114.1 hypothetical protein DHW03_15055 [Pedobacter yonginense]
MENDNKNIENAHSVHMALKDFHSAMITLSANDLANLHATDAIYEFALLTTGRPERYMGQMQIRNGFQ